MSRRQPQQSRPWLPLTLLVAALLAGCSTSRHATDDRDRDAAEEVRAAEATFRPSDHDPVQAAAPTALPFPTDTARTEPTNTPELPASGEMTQGYRVQAFATRNIDEAQVKKVELEGLFPGEWFYLDYASPSYKIRAGNFTTRFEADRFARMMIEQGFPEAWVVPERVFKNIGRRPVQPPQPSEQPEVK